MNIKNLKNGILGGLAGGAVFGMMMAMMGMGRGGRCLCRGRSPL